MVSHHDEIFLLIPRSLLRGGFIGFAVDVRQMPRDIQEVAYEKGLIPYLPGER